MIHVPFIEVGVSPIDGQKHLVLSLSGMRQFREFLDEAISYFHKTLADEPEGPKDICQQVTTLGNTRVVLMTDETLVKLMDVVKDMAGLPAGFNPFVAKDQNGKVIDDYDHSAEQLPDWYMNLMNGTTTEDDNNA